MKRSHAHCRLSLRLSLQIRAEHIAEFYERVVATVSTRFKGNPRETRATLGEPIGGAIKLTPKDEAPDAASHFGLRSCRALSLLLGAQKNWATVEVALAVPLGDSPSR
jgi:hypothetical protein